MLVVESQLSFAVPQLALQLGDAVRNGRRVVLDSGVVLRKYVRTVEIGEGIGGNDGRQAGEELKHERGIPWSVNRCYRASA